MQSSDRYSGIDGSRLELAIFIIASYSFLNAYSPQGSPALAISMTRHPSDQISAFLPYPLFYIISGATQGKDPFI